MIVSCGPPSSYTNAVVTSRSSAMDSQRKLRRRSRSNDRLNGSGRSNFSDFLNRGFSLRGKVVHGSSCDLSMDPSSPGVLKIFGESLQVGAEYKSILVSPRSSAGEVIAEVLERYGVSRRVSDQFQLFDAVGKLTTPSRNHGGISIFTEEYSRALDPLEHVMTVQCLWRPMPGFYRRFEIRRRLLPEASDGKVVLRNGGPSGYHSDNETRGINDNARKYARAKVRSELRNSFDMRPFTDSETNSQTTQTSPTPARVIAPPRQYRTTPLGPYLLLLRGLDARTDVLVQELFDSNLIGRSSNCDVVLAPAEGIAPEHCLIQTFPGESAERAPRTMFVEPCLLDPGDPSVLTTVTVNGRSVNSQINLSPGDLLGIGRHYIFLFKDAAQTPDRFLTLPWLQRKISTNSVATASSIRSVRRTPVDPSRAHRSESITSSLSCATTRAADCSLSSRTSSPIHNARLDLLIAQLLEENATITEVAKEAVPLESAVCLLLLLVQRVAGRVDLSEEVQWQLSERVCALSQQAQADTESKMSETWRQVGDVVRACAINFEAYLFLNGEMAAKVSDNDEGSRKAWSGFFESLAQQTLDDVIKIIAEEGVDSATALFHDNQFAGQPLSNDIPSMDAFIQFLDSLHRTVEEVTCVSSSQLKRLIFKKLTLIIGQQALQNVISDRDNCRWTRGVQLRANLDCFEEWIREHNMQELMDYMILLSSVIDLLATPKSQIMAMSWLTLRSAFPDIPVSVLRFILEHYEKGRGASLISWIPSQEDEVEAEYDPVCALEDAFHHLQEMTTVSECRCRSFLHIDTQIDNEDFLTLVKALSKELAESECVFTWTDIVTEYRQSQGSVADSNCVASLSAEASKDSAYSSAASHRSTSFLPTSNLPFVPRLELHELRKLAEMSDERRSSKSSSEPSRRQNGRRAPRSVSPKPTFALVAYRETPDPRQSGDLDEEDDRSIDSVSLGSLTEPLSPEQRHLRHRTAPVRSDTDSENEDIFVAELKRNESGSFGLGVVDGQMTALKQPGIYVRSLVTGGMAEKDGRLQLGDRILAVNGRSLVGMSYDQAMDLIRTSESTVQLLIAKSDLKIAMKVIASNC